MTQFTADDIYEFFNKQAAALAKWPQLLLATLSGTGLGGCVSSGRIAANTILAAE